jgi:hypothetical protein
VNYSGTPLAKKLGIKRGARVALVNAPAGFEESLAGLPAGVSIKRSAGGSLDVILVFSTSRSHLTGLWPRLMAALDPSGGLWVAYPKKSSGVATDLGFGWVQELGLDAGLVDNKSCAIDDTYSGLRFVYRLVDRPSPK